MAFFQKRRFPGVKENDDGAIHFSLTEEEWKEAELALKDFEGLTVHPDVAEKVRQGTIAVALSRYAQTLCQLNCVAGTESELKSK